MRALPKKPAVDAVRNEINVTPLVDVCLVLLIIFMVITPMLARGKEVPLPETEYYSKEKDKLQPVISIGRKKDGGEVLVWVAGKTAQGKQEMLEVGLLGDIENPGTRAAQAFAETIKKEVERLWEISAEDAKGKLFIKVANDIPYKRVYPLLMLLNADLSMSTIELGTAEKKRG